MIKVENLSKAFGTIKAVDGLSFEIKSGELVGFLGPNGAGKSTTMRLLTGFLTPDEGHIYIEGIQMQSGAVEAQRSMGYMPENNPLYKDMLVAELLDLSASLKHIPKSQREAQFDFVVTATGIGAVFYRPVRELSKGYKQRVGLAAALLHKPNILILDEPTEGLDPNQRAEIRTLMKDLAKDRTILVSTHVMQEVSAVCDRVLIMHQGRLVADGSPNALTAGVRGERALQLEIEGEGLTERLGSQEKILIETSENIAPGRYRFKLRGRDGATLPPLLSVLAREHGWVIWNLSQEEFNLEDIFKQLTTQDEP